MDKKKLVLLVGALIIALGTAFMAKSLFTGAGAPTSEAAVNSVPTGPKVLVATRALPVGTIITPDSFVFQPWPKELVESAYFLEGAANPSSFLGTVVRNPITAGQPVTQGSLVNPGDRGFLAAALGPGMRAVTVPVSARTGVAGFVFPGDRIDLVLTQSISGEEGPDLKTSETIIRNLRVLATDQKTVPETKEGTTVVTEFTSVTVEATPKIAEKIAVAQTIGTLSLSLRSIADNQAELEAAIAAGSVNVPDGADAKTEARILRAAASQPADTEGTFVTGGDVSRFQRRTVPPQTKPKSNDGYQPAPAATMAAATESKPIGPVVRITRGKTVTEVPVGGK